METTANNQDGLHSGTLAGMYLPEEVAQAFGADFLDEAFCRQWILSRLHSGARCPQCHRPLAGRALPRFKKGARIRCNACGKFFTALTGTFLSGCHLDYRSMILLPLLLRFGLRHDRIAATLHVSAGMVRLWEIKFQALERLKEMVPTHA